ncbi:LysR family transcriptional regulator [Bacillus sp. JCM 19041]|uniref:LysR family transcriptional regulator n=1 Tax=Bacillus sp. JCM 19041 TaxID=1460637 RepID=UPI000B1C0E1F
MDLRSIKTFQTIVKHRSFQKAAEELSYAQSTITMQIKKLEKEFGATLIERGKPFQLTEAGRLLLVHGELLLKDYDVLQDVMGALINGESGHIRIGAMEPAASFRLPDLIASFYKKYPRVNVSIHIESSRKLIEMVQEGQVDLAIGTAPDTLSAVHFLPLFEEPIAILIPTIHALSKEEEVNLSQLEDEQILITTAACPFRRNLEKQMIDQGLRPSYRMEISNMLALKHYVQAGYGIAAVPIIAAAPPPEGTVLKKNAVIRTRFNSWFASK